MYLDLAAESYKMISPEFLSAKVKEVAEIIKANKRVNRVLSYWLLAAAQFVSDVLDHAHSSWLDAQSCSSIRIMIHNPSMQLTLIRLYSLLSPGVFCCYKYHCKCECVQRQWFHTSAHII